MSKRKKRKKSGGKKVPEEENKLCWDIAKVMTNRKYPKELYNKRVYCKSCKQEYCLGFSGSDSYCADCYYNDSCLKETDGGRICQNCGG